QGFMGEKFGHDNIWESHLATEFYKTSIPIEAVLDEMMLPLQRVMSLEVGVTVVLNSGPDDSVQLRCGGIPLVTGIMGRTGSNIAVSVAGGIAKPR
ncbi:MAG: FliM/FliN family flagellar motor switch protein, partial [Hyphomicrobiaceae bacterium]|nr:FliM/FliN family flagellar motor switch protein [Hyphomicrobiaceae bacterium]